MPVEKRKKWRCENCYAKVYEEDVIVVDIPKLHRQISLCPECEEINTLVKACDEEGCWGFVSCGTPTDNGYRSTCHKHAPCKKEPK